MANVKDEEQNSVPSSRARSSSTYPHLGPGETYLDFWSRSLEQYKQMKEALLRPYTGKPRQTDQEEKEVLVVRARGGLSLFTSSLEKLFGK
jgi:hypothetical protein